LKRLKIIIIGEITPQIRYLSLYSQLVLIPFSTNNKSIIKILKFCIDLFTSIIFFKPNAILVYPSYPWGIISIIYSKLFQLCHICFSYGNDVFRRTKIGKIIVKIILILSDGIIIDSMNIYDFVKKEGGKNIIFIPMGIDVSEFKHFKIKKEENNIITIVNFQLAYWKGIDLLIKAIRLIPNVNLTIIGEGPQRKKMTNYAKCLNVMDRVKFTGYVSKKVLWYYLQKSNIFVLPTRSSFCEGSNRSILEAMLCGLPIITTCTGGLPYLVKNNKNGILIKPNSITSIVKAIIFLFNKQDLMENMGKNNKEKAKKYFAYKLSKERYIYIKKTVEQNN
jgi:glycosyltransferase involved in cell wall biosynthesis